MAADTVRGCLRRAANEIEGVCEYDQVDESDENRLKGIMEQLRYHLNGDREDPEAVVSPDPNALETIATRLGEVVTSTDGDVAARLSRARDEVFLAMSLLDDRLEKQRNV